MDKKQMEKMKIKSSLSSKEKKKKQEEVKQQVFVFKKQKENFEVAKRNFEQCKKAFYSYMEENDVVEEFYPIKFNRKEDESLGGTKVQKIVRTHISWDIDKLENKLDKVIRNKVIKKSYSINNMECLIALLKEYDVPSNKFKKYIDVERTVDSELINNLSDIGEITNEDIKGCYTVKEDAPYWTVKDVEGKKESE